ncbi:MAG: hypothetical protein Ct9H300mP13_4220 [Gammaproteobacteria bacterium]|nr:MAG: hypothetical protein Ct9H300mP13_4220 [Gammaproteobacteria bacterium]
MRPARLSLRNKMTAANFLPPARAETPRDWRKKLIRSWSKLLCDQGNERRRRRYLLEELKDHVLQEKYIYRHKYRIGDVAIWDTFQTMHSGTKSTSPQVNRMPDYSGVSVSEVNHDPSLAPRSLTRPGLHSEHLHLTQCVLARKSWFAPGKTPNSSGVCCQRSSHNGLHRIFIIPLDDDDPICDSSGWLRNFFSSVWV